MTYRNPVALLLGLMLTACGSSSTDAPSDGDPADQLTGERYPALLAYPGDSRLLVPANRLGSLPEHSRMIGDVNGDGLADVAQVVRESIDRYSAAVYFTSMSGDFPAFDELDGYNGFVLENVYGNINSPDDNPPWSDGLFDVGDLNGDGYDDIGFQNFHWEESEWDPDGGFTRGWGYKVLPGAASFDARRSVLAMPSAKWLVELGTTTGELGLGDIDGDGFDDLLIGSRWQTNQILYGSATMNVVLSSEDVERELGDYANVICGGCGIRPLGDFDADGFDDLLLSSRTQECGYSDAVLVVYGRPGGIAAGTLPEFEAQQHTRIVNEAGGRCNSSGFLASSGDVDGDGAADLLQYYYPIYADDRNRASLVFGRVGVRPPAISQDELDGAKGFVMDLGSSLYSDGNQPLDAGELSIDDIDGDGFGDILFPDDTMFRGHVRDVSAVAVPVVVRYPETVTVGWHGYDMSSPSAFRIDIDGVMLTDLGGDERSHSFPDPSGGAAFELSLHALAASGEILSTSRRLVPANIGKEQLTGEVQGDRLIELTFNGDRTIEYFSHYLVWRDGVPIGRSLNGADNYVDISVLPGTTYQFFITPDYLADGSLDPTTVQHWPLLQRRSNTVELTTPGEKPVDDGTVTPVEPGENLSAAPSGIRLQIYASQIAELFWTSADGVLSTAVFRDGEYLGSTQGESYYDAMREPDVPHHYALIATAADGSLSPMIVLDTFEDMSVAMVAADDQSFIGPGPIDYDANTLAVLQEVYGPDSGRQELWLLDRTQAAENPEPWQRVVTFQAEQSETRFSHLSGGSGALAMSADTVLVGNIIETIDFSDPDTDEPYSFHFEFSVIERDENGNLLEPRLLDFDDLSPPVTSYEHYPSVALHGMRALIGGRNDAAYVVERNEAGDWQFVQSLASVDGKSLGDAVALFGDTAVAASGGGTELHVFRRDSAGGWLEHQRLTGLPDSAGASSLLLAMSEDTIALAEQYNSSDGIRLYRLDSAGTWYPEDIVANDDAQLNSLALEGDTLLLGLPYGQGLALYTGAVAVYQRQDSSQWIRKSSLYAADGGAQFGDAVALDDDIGVVLGTGAPPDSSYRVYFFALSGP